MRADIAPGGTFPDDELPITQHATQAQRAAGRRPADPHARARPLLPEGATAASGARRVLPEDRRGVHPDATISTDDHHTLQEFRASVGAQWTSSPTRTERFRRTSIFRSTPTREQTR